MFSNDISIPCQTIQVCKHCIWKLPYMVRLVTCHSHITLGNQKLKIEMIPYMVRLVTYDCHTLLLLVSWCFQNLFSAFQLYAGYLSDLYMEYYVILPNMAPHMYYHLVYLTSLRLVRYKILSIGNQVYQLINYEVSLSLYNEQVFNKLKNKFSINWRTRNYSSHNMCFISLIDDLTLTSSNCIQDEKFVSDVMLDDCK